MKNYYTVYNDTLHNSSLFQDDIISKVDRLESSCTDLKRKVNYLEQQNRKLRDKVEGFDEEKITYIQVSF